jgi:SNF2-related domain
MFEAVPRAGVIHLSNCTAWHLHADSAAVAADAPALAAHVGADAPGDGGGSGDWCGATLVICPLVAVIQWGQEIARFTEPGSVKVGVMQHSRRQAVGD